MMNAVRALVVAILFFTPAALIAQSPGAAPGPTETWVGEVGDASERRSPSEALAPAPSPLLFVAGQRLLVAPELESADQFEAASAFQPEQDRRTNLSLIAAGATLLVAGSFIDGSAGTVVMVSGALFSAVGVYRWVR